MLGGASRPPQRLHHMLGGGWRVSRRAPPSLEAMSACSGHQSEITREQLSLPLASPPSPPGIRGILWVVQSIDLWLVSQPHFEGAMKYSDRHLAGLSAGPPDRVELIGAGSLGYGTGPSFG